VDILNDYKPNPDFNHLLSVLRNECPARPTLFEFFMNLPLYEQFAGELPANCPEHLKELVLTIQAYRNLGYDYAPVVQRAFSFSSQKTTKASCSMNEGAVITDRESFDRFEWPDADAVSFDFLDEVQPFVPDGMKLIAWGPNGVFETGTDLVGYENLCIMTMEAEDLVMDIFREIGSRFVRYYERCLEHDLVGAVISNDDWGFRSQTLLSPSQLRRFIFPWHRKIAEAAHSAGRPAILHSCGQLEAVWDDIIDDMRFDGKHSNEDTILPVEEAYEKYGDRIAIIGGIDLDFVCRSTLEEVSRRAEAMIERTAQRGGYALGTGNSIPEYTPVENYLAMIRPVLEQHSMGRVN
jgi:uroporphyrinogen decarboxylase